MESGFSSGGALYCRHRRGAYRFTYFFNNAMKSVYDVREFNGKEYPLWAILTFSVLALQSSASIFGVHRYSAEYYEVPGGN
jgi:hypothetical protein